MCNKNTKAKFEFGSSRIIWSELCPLDSHIFSLENFNESQFKTLLPLDAFVSPRHISNCIQ